jgi:signal transduction histidine kinase
MRPLRDLPIRVRLTLAFAVGSAVILGAVGAFVYVRTGAALLETVDTGLLTKADALDDLLLQGRLDLGSGEAFEVEEEDFAQVTDGAGHLLDGTPGFDAPLVPADVLRSVRSRRLLTVESPDVENVARVLLDPVITPEGRRVLVVGVSLQDRREAMLGVAAVLGIAGPVALGLMSLAGWLLAGALLRPVEAMRREAEAISAVEPGRRLPVPAGDDEIVRLGRTLNAMLDRIGRSVEGERRFLDDASHELRTPLAILKGELDLALLRDRSPDEYRATLARAEAEADRLVRLAEDLLVLSRSRPGTVAIHRERVPIRPLVEETAARHGGAAAAAGIRLEVEAVAEALAVDPTRLRQVLDNLLDNAVRHSPPGGVVRVEALLMDDTLRLSVSDQGQGFPAELLGRAFEPFARGDDGERGAGLGLAIVQAVARAHGGVATAENRPGGGAMVTVTIPVEGRTGAPPERLSAGPETGRASEPSVAIANGSSKERVAEPVPEQ